MAFNESDDKELSPQSYLHSLRCVMRLFFAKLSAMVSWTASDFAFGFVYSFFFCSEKRL
ncbi:hypothetical protein BRARA_I02880 [Brassica rapa]|uniref:Uncharacterized protein n=1 Tax=Brassica campestris TaxID=3711 RepID=A0A397Y5N2_BRACM|nr:hypothetical protein BRARA_I02880 [Brassica rapa]